MSYGNNGGQLDFVTTSSAAAAVANATGGRLIVSSNNSNANDLNQEPYGHRLGKRYTLVI